jgi:hypothetical protein
MRRQLRRQLLTMSLAILAVVAIVVWYQQSIDKDDSPQVGVDLGDAQRTITYLSVNNVGESGATAAERWIEFAVLPGRAAIQLSTTANLDPRMLADLPRPLTVDYVLDYEFIYEDGRQTEIQQYYETATLGVRPSRSLYADSNLVPVSAPSVQIELRPVGVRMVRVRLVNAEPWVTDVGVRINALERVSPRDASSRWLRLTTAQQANLFDGSVYPPELARPAERAALTSTRWVPLEYSISDQRLRWPR